MMLLADGMRAARKPGHADRVGALMSPSPTSDEAAIVKEAP
ncbi:hypothetical protein [Streptomyces sp. JV184]|nr:hypothetical protein [Streptomyces sp. JV184]MEE1743214.1 hypothetical protein [Streptomyces sp. JV184]